MSGVKKGRGRLLFRSLTVFVLICFLLSVLSVLYIDFYLPQANTTELFHDRLEDFLLSRNATTITKLSVCRSPEATTPWPLGQCPTPVNHNLASSSNLLRDDDNITNCILDTLRFSLKQPKAAAATLEQASEAARICGDQLATRGRSFATTLSNNNKRTTCGFCQQNEFTRFMEQVSHAIRVKLFDRINKHTKCPLLIYSVHLGHARRRIPLDLKDAAGGDSDHCQFLFLLETTIKQDQNYTPAPNSNAMVWRHTIDKSQMFVPIPDHLLPYKSMRRNVKLIKLHGPQLFHWAQRLLWYDAKFPALIPMWQFHRFYNETIVANNVCASMIGLPNHKSTMGDRYSMFRSSSFENHCHAILQATTKRPNVTDSADAIHDLCDMYSSKTSHNVNVLDHGLIDSALIAWDTQSPRCRHFIADLTCTWADEIQCHADRDQLSFPIALDSLQLVESNGRGDTSVAKKAGTWHLATHNTIWLDRNNQQHDDEPLLEIVKSSCHWYVQPTFTCDLSSSSRNDWSLSGLVAKLNSG